MRFRRYGVCPMKPHCSVARNDSRDARGLLHLRFAPVQQRFRRRVWQETRVRSHFCVSECAPTRPSFFISRSFLYTVNGNNGESREDQDGVISDRTAKKVQLAEQSFLSSEKSWRPMKNKSNGESKIFHNEYSCTNSTLRLRPYFVRIRKILVKYFCKFKCLQVTVRLSRPQLRCFINPIKPVGPTRPADRRKRRRRKEITRGMKSTGREMGNGFSVSRHAGRERAGGKGGSRRVKNGDC